MVTVYPTQNGTYSTDEFNTVTVRPDGAILLAGWTGGTWTLPGDVEGWYDYAAVLIDGDVRGTPSPEKTNVRTSPPTTSPFTAPPAATELTPGPALQDTQVSLSVSPVTTDSSLPSTSVPTYGETQSTPSSSTSLGVVVGCAVGAAAALVAFGLLVTRVVRRSRCKLEAGGITSFPVVRRPIPDVVPPASSGQPHRHRSRRL